MTTPKEKAIELYNKFRNENPVMAINIRAKKQALICVNEIIDIYETDICKNGYDNDWDMWEANKQYWLNVRSEITKL